VVVLDGDKGDNDRFACSKQKLDQQVCLDSQMIKRKIFGIL
jgi:hypothetical protein